MNNAVILLEPEIPQNTGNIARTCAATGTELILIRPLGFSIDEKSVRRAGLDYWNKLTLRVYDSFGEYMADSEGAVRFFLSTKAPRSYTETAYPTPFHLIFGKESAGIPETILNDHIDSCFRIPMLPEIRSLNLSNSVAVVLYEALRQHDFGPMQKAGKLRFNSRNSVEIH